MAIATTGTTTAGAIMAAWLDELLAETEGEGVAVPTGRAVNGASVIWLVLNGEEGFGTWVVDEEREVEEVEVDVDEGVVVVVVVVVCD